MLDPQTYRASEILAKSGIPHWRVAQIHNLDHFERVGFPVRLNSVRDLGQIVDSMQENRFDGYMQELGGLTVSEYEWILRACRDSVRFQLSYLPHRTPVLPISTLLSVYALYVKISGANPNFRRVLEIGPGCGYLPFFLKEHGALLDYSQIEACESFYILQNLVNVHCFGDRFDERALAPEENSLVDFFINHQRNDMEFAPNLTIDRWPPRCHHYPWWRIGELISKDRHFDVVTSNANLLEFNPEALDDYLSLLHRVMEPTGVFVVQCTGWPAHGNDEQLLDKMHAKGFVPLLFVTANNSVKYSGEKAGSASGMDGGTRDSIKFITNNAVFIKQGHPLFEKYHDRKNYHLRFVAPEDVVRKMYFDRPGGRRFYSLGDFIENTERSFVEGPVG